MFTCVLKRPKSRYSPIMEMLWQRMHLLKNRLLNRELVNVSFGYESSIGSDSDSKIIGSGFKSRTQIQNLGPVHSC